MAHEALLQAAAQTTHLWDDELDSADLTDGIAVEARLALAINVEITALDQRIVTLVDQRDPAGTDATHWDEVVTALGFEYLRRHDLRHTGLPWMADAGVPLHVLRLIA